MLMPNCTIERGIFRGPRGGKYTRFFTVCSCGFVAPPAPGDMFKEYHEAEAAKQAHERKCLLETYYAE